MFTIAKWLKDKLSKPAKAPRTAKASAGADYEAWKLGKIGQGPKVKAPRGMGQEYEARLWCEKAIARGWQNYHGRGSSKQYRPGSYNYRRREGYTHARQQAWLMGLEPAEAVMKAEGPGVTWVGKKELIKECLEVSSSMLTAYVN